MALERVRVEAAGLLYEGWERVTITAALNDACRHFEIATTEVITATESPFDKWHFPPGTPVRVRSHKEQRTHHPHEEGDVMVTGAVDDYLPSADAETHNVTIVGRSAGRDFVDSSPYHPTGVFEGNSVREIAEALAAPFGVNIVIDRYASAQAARVVPYFGIQRGSTGWHELMRLLANSGLTMTSDAAGNIVLTRGSKDSHPGMIAQGPYADSVPIQSMSARLSSAERFRFYTAIGQDSFGTEEDNFNGEVTVEDSNVPTPRRREIILDENADRATLRQRAIWERARAAGRSMTAEVTVRGWRDIGGTLWTPGWSVHTISAFLKIDQPMMIESATFIQNNEAATVASLSLVDPRAYLSPGPPPQHHPLIGGGSVWEFFT